MVKSIANQTKTVHVLFGTYDLLAFRNLNGQLSRRSIDVHLSRYRADDSEDRQIFINVVRCFEKELPFDDEPDLVSDWEQMHAETADGELKLTESGQAVVRLRDRLGLFTSATKSDPKQPDSSAKFRRPGQRLPTRDVVGQMGANAAAL